VRAANTGISGIVDPYGHILERTDIYHPALVVGDVRLLTAATIYAQAGDVFAYASATATLVLLGLSRAKPRRVQ